MKADESKLQIQCVQWFRLKYPNYSNMLFAIPNGGNRNAITGAILKREGVVPGVADLMLCVSTWKYHGLFIEMKVGKNKQSPAQKEFQRSVEANGYKYELCYSFDEFVSAIKNYVYLEKLA